MRHLWPEAAAHPSADLELRTLYIYIILYVYTLLTNHITPQHITTHKNAQHMTLCKLNCTLHYVALRYNTLRFTTCR